MRKIIGMGLLFVLLFAGCSTQKPVETTESTVPTTQETTPKGLYIPGSDPEKQTNGAVRQYRIDDPEAQLLGFISDKPLILASGMLSVLSGDDCVPTASIPVPKNFENCQTTHKGVVYYNEEEKAAIFLDTQLREENRIALPENLIAPPVFSGNGNEIFYCQGQEIRSIDVEYGISRLIRTHACTNQTLLGSWFDGKVLACHIQREDGEETLYISGQTGELLSNDEHLEGLSSYQDRFLAQRKDGSVTQWIVGSLEDVPRQLTGISGKVVSALELGGVVDIRESDALDLTFYSLTSGETTAQVQLAVPAPRAVFADRWCGSVWLLTDMEGENASCLLRWRLKDSPMEEKTQAAITPVYSAQEPDEAGLEICQERADRLNKAHGIRIRIWKDAMKYTDGTILEGEYQTPAIQACLDSLETVLDALPSDFLYKSVSDTLRICIVRSINGNSGSAHFRVDGDTFIVLTPDCDIPKAFIKELGYVVDTHVLGKSAVYDYWDTLNPEGFQYGQESTYRESWLEGDTRCFLSETAMSSVVEDRSSLFYAAMQPDNGQLFQSPAMQAKLKMLCEGIRDAWRWKRKTDTYPWEQYLAEPLTTK